MNRFERVSVETSFPVAYDSPDHLSPWGTIRDSSRNPRFNEKLYRLFSDLNRPLRVLDLGCSGGGFIRDCQNEGCIAVGLEGSDNSLRMKRAEWATIGGHSLFTCDISKPFKVWFRADGSEIPATFDVITSWEVLEHIREDSLPTVCENVKSHMSPNGIAIFSVSMNSDKPNGVELHQTIKPEHWWLDMFKNNGFDVHPELNRYFNGQFVRGPRQWAPHSFTVVLSHTAAVPVAAKPLTLKNRIMDAWYCSPAQRLARRLVVGSSAE